MDAFDRLAPPIQKWIRNQGWSELRDVQARTVHAVMDSERDLIVAASTAGGKTEAAFLPLISSVIDQDASAGAGFDLVYVGPLKALINDQQRRLEDMCRQAELRVFPWHGDISGAIKKRARTTPGGILLITPESLEALFVRRGLDIPRLFGRAKAIVIDEMHTFLDSSRGVQLRSLLTRLELATGRSVRRIGLSATLGDMELAKSFLRPGGAADVDLLEAKGDGSDLLIQLRGYVVGGRDKPKTDVAESAGGNKETGSAETEIAQHLFAKLRGTNNLIFAGSRQQVELLSNRLIETSEQLSLPQEFYPHHASLSKEHREFVEQRLKDGRPPTSAICTSTLELGIDIGDVTCVAQVGAPFTVASLRQRLGRSGRRPGQPAILRQYVIETELDAHSNFADRLRLRLVRSVAMIELLLQGWCESPKPHALNLSVLAHQILSVIAERGGASAARIFATLCQAGPFREVDSATFASVLRALGAPEADLIEQGPDGFLLLGRKGEKLVEHYSFFAVFKTPEEYRILCAGRELGTIPIDNVMSPGMALILSGRRWEVITVDEDVRVIEVKPSKGGVPPRFGGDGGMLDDEVARRMRDIYLATNVPVYLDSVAKDLLAEGRANFTALRLRSERLVALGENADMIATRAGSATTQALVLMLAGSGFVVTPFDGFIEVDRKQNQISTRDALRAIADGDGPDLFGPESAPMSEKLHPYLTPDLLQRDALSSWLNVAGARLVAAEIINGS